MDTKPFGVEVVGDEDVLPRAKTTSLLPPSSSHGRSCFPQAATTTQPRPILHSLDRQTGEFRSFYL